jgi:hypothetical protein
VVVVVVEVLPEAKLGAKRRTEPKAITTKTAAMAAITFVFI